MLSTCRAVGLIPELKEEEGSGPNDNSSHFCPLPSLSQLALCPHGNLTMEDLSPGLIPRWSHNTHVPPVEWYLQTILGYPERTEGNLPSGWNLQKSA